MQSAAATVPAYLKELPDAARKALTKIRALLRRTAPDAEEAMRHGMPYYTLHGDFCAFAAQKRNFALYVCDVELVARRKAGFGKVNCGKSCIRFKSLGDLNLDAVRELLEEAAERARAKAAAG
jgi:uncharacterized protein YdhG (YjbR/CyaY superfamily)